MVQASRDGGQVPWPLQKFLYTIQTFKEPNWLRVVIVTVMVTGTVLLLLMLLRLSPARVVSCGRRWLGKSVQLKGGARRRASGRHQGRELDLDGVLRRPDGRALIMELELVTLRSLTLQRGAHVAYSRSAPPGREAHVACSRSAPPSLHGAGPAPPAPGPRCV